MPDTMISLLAAIHLKLFVLYAMAAQAADAIDFSALAAQLLAAYQAHAYVMLGALAIGALVAFAKQGWLSVWLATRIPARYLPVLAVALGVLGTASTSLISGRPLLQAVLDGLASAMVAVFGHQVVVEGFRRGKEIVPMHPALRRLDTTDPGTPPQV